MCGMLIVSILLLKLWVCLVLWKKCCDHGGSPYVPHGSNLDDVPTDMRCHLIGMGTMRKLLTSAKSWFQLFVRFKPVCFYTQYVAVVNYFVWLCWQSIPFTLQPCWWGDSGVPLSPCIHGYQCEMSWVPQSGFQNVLRCLKTISTCFYVR